MNSNANGARTLAYLRGEKDLFEERKRIAEIKRQFQRPGLGYWLSNVHRRRVERFWQIVSLLQENSRMTLTEMSRRLKVPVSTLYDNIKEVEKFFRFTIVLKEGNILARNVPATFEFSYQATTDKQAETEVPLSLYAKQEVG